MKCPFCAFEDTQVKDSRASDDGHIIKRRRQCLKCNNRFTTIEKIQFREISVIKKNGEKRPFDREKISRSISIAFRKRQLSSDQIESLVNQVTAKVESLGNNEVHSKTIGEIIMSTLAEVDQVAYVRFASVYKEFSEAKDFEKFLTKIDKNK
ncbi:MAG: transcriptional repressor NrdR [Sphingobacteriia bacterium]|nr:transcriptional repressor NrdR [Sphingobacteriia bacterium]